MGLLTSGFWQPTKASNIGWETVLVAVVIRVFFLPLSLKLNNLTGGKQWCRLALEMDPENIDALCDRAELYISQHMYEQAVEDYQTAHRIEDHPKKVSQYYFSSL